MVCQEETLVRSLQPENDYKKNSYSKPVVNEKRLPKKLDLSSGYEYVSLWAKLRSQYIYAKKCLDQHVVVYNDMGFYSGFQNCNRTRELQPDRLLDPVGETLKVMREVYQPHPQANFQVRGYFFAYLIDEEGRMCSSPVAVPECARSDWSILLWFTRKFDTPIAINITDFFGMYIRPVAPEHVIELDERNIWCDFSFIDKW
jgi:hypothetical protein